MEKFITKELDFNDVLILPQPSSISSPNEVNLERTISFVNIIDEDNSDDDNYEDKKIPKKWSGIPIITTKMDIIGTFRVYDYLKQYKMLTALNRCYTVNDYMNAVNKLGIELDPEYFMVTTGITEENFKNLTEIVLYTNCKWIY